jgi:dihydrolipoamide dehydrogenase
MARAWRGRGPGALPIRPAWGMVRAGSYGDFAKGDRQMSDAYDVVVIGAGPGGYVAAIRAAQLGMKTACVEARETLGGTCLNIGCIPSKAMLHASQMFAEAGGEMAHLGIKMTPKLDLKQMMAHKSETVEANVKGIEFLFKKNKVDWIRGTGKLAGAGKIEITGGKDEGKTVEAKHIIIATGSESTPIPNVEVDEKQIVTSTGALELRRCRSTWW